MLNLRWKLLACVYLSYWCVCCNPLMWTLSLTWLFPSLYSFYLPLSLLLFSHFCLHHFRFTFLLVSSVSLLWLKTWKIYTTISIDTCLPQRTNGLAISPQRQSAAWQLLHPPALCAVRQVYSPSPASKNASCPRRAEKRPSKGWRYIYKHFSTKREVKGLNE